ncbi:hypothetical protein BaOVIS_000450 [Babesia ovis]|uniref:Uncharacterized protein n=1 Tax=Babesia ovis TaxID=5869 RepID=A0A9W5T8E3_BABOV|nr:hypothetical protein BaOVIS_000450 [Babesia ovis]
MDTPAETGRTLKPTNVAELLSNLTEQQTRLMETYKGFLQSMQLESNLKDAKGKLSGLQKAGAELIELQKDHIRKMLLMLYPIFRLVMPEAQFEEDPCIQMLQSQEKLNTYDLVELSCVLRCYFAKLAVYIYHMATFVQDRAGYERVVSSDPNLSKRDVMFDASDFDNTNLFEPLFPQDSIQYPAEDRSIFANMTANGWYDRMTRIYQTTPHDPTFSDGVSSTYKRDLNLDDLANDDFGYQPQELKAASPDYLPTDRVTSQDIPSRLDAWDSNAMLDLPDYSYDKDIADIMDPTNTSYSTTQLYGGADNHFYQGEIDGFYPPQNDHGAFARMMADPIRYTPNEQPGFNTMMPPMKAHIQKPMQQSMQDDGHVNQEMFIPPTHNNRVSHSMRSPMVQPNVYAPVAQPQYVQSIPMRGPVAPMMKAPIPPNRHIYTSNAHHKVQTRDNGPQKATNCQPAKNCLRPMNRNDIFNTAAQSPQHPENDMTNMNILGDTQRHGMSQVLMQQMLQHGRVYSPTDDLCCGVECTGSKHKGKHDLRSVMSQEALHPSFYSHRNVVKEGVHVKGTGAQKDITYLIYDSPLHRPAYNEPSEIDYSQMENSADGSLHDANAVYPQSSIHTTLDPNNMPAYFPASSQDNVSYHTSVNSVESHMINPVPAALQQRQPVVTQVNNLANSFNTMQVPPNNSGRPVDRPTQSGRMSVRNDVARKPAAEDFVDDVEHSYREGFLPRTLVSHQQKAETQPNVSNTAQDQGDNMCFTVQLSQQDVTAFQTVESSDIESARAVDPEFDQPKTHVPTMLVKQDSEVNITHKESVHESPEEPGDNTDYSGVVTFNSREYGDDIKTGVTQPQVYANESRHTAANVVNESVLQSMSHISSIHEDLQSIRHVESLESSNSMEYKQSSVNDSYIQSSISAEYRQSTGSFDYPQSMSSMEYDKSIDVAKEYSSRNPDASESIDNSKHSYNAGDSIPTVIAEQLPAPMIVEEPPDLTNGDNDGYGEWVKHCIRRGINERSNIDKIESMPNLDDDDDLSSSGIHIPPLDMAKLNIRGSSM